MTKGLVRSLGRGPELDQKVVKKMVVVVAKTLTVAGASGVGFGSIVISDFVQGNVMFLGAVAYFQFSGPTSGSLSDTWAGDYGIGTTPAGDGTISNADVDMIPSTALAAATAEVSPNTRATQADGAKCGQIFDNTDGSLEINLSLLIDNADISADGIDMSVTGELHISYAMLGDD